jgi:acyl-CoA reductase-like NAD-dependent aldehyde dehydrogenase
LANSAPKTDLDYGVIRCAQQGWNDTPTAKRRRIISRFRVLLAQNAQNLAIAICAGTSRQPAEAVLAEILPLAEGCRFLEKRSKKLLAPVRLSAVGRPGWLVGSTAQIVREPYGIVLVLAPFNYPLFLPGVQALHALAAGNAVIVKPGSGGSGIITQMASLLNQAGLPPHLFTVTGESVETGKELLTGDIDKVVLTGSAETGAKVLCALAERAIPATIELSGNDAVIVLPTAETKLVADAMAYGLRLNGSQTCIAPRRVIVVGDSTQKVTSAILQRVDHIPPAQIPEPVAARVQTLVTGAKNGGAEILCGSADPNRFTPFVVRYVSPNSELLETELFAPVISIVHVRDDVEAIALANASPFGLGASIFGDPIQARAIAGRLDTGFVTINDMIVQTADPRTPFGGRKRSGFGVTRGAEGLLAMTRPKTIFLRKGKFRPHLNALTPDDLDAYSNLLIAMHSRGFTQRLKAFMTAIRHLSSRIKSD